MRLGVACLFAVSCTSGAEGREDCHWIGSISPLTGDLGPLGLTLENAARLAVQDVNEAGGLADKALCIATGDSRTQPERAKLVVEALIEQNGALAINGPAASVESLAAVAATKPLDMTLISCCSTAPEVSEEPYIYRTVPSDALQGVAMAKLAAERNVERLSVIYLADPYGTQLRDSFKSAYATESGRSPSVEVPYESGAVNFAEVVSSAFSVDPELVVLIAFPIAGAEIIKAWVESGGGEGVLWLATDGIKDDQFVLLSGEGLPHVIGTAPTPSSPHYPGFEARYQETFGASPGIFTSNQYDAIILIALAMAKVGADPSPPEIRRELPELSRPGGEEVDAETIDNLAIALDAVKQGNDVNYQGVSGTVDMDDRGDVLGLYRVWSIPEGGGAISEENTCFECRVATATIGVQCGETTCP
jgi:ABC-type branched-subunit amino acid transport system substrate-binding protein